MSNTDIRYLHLKFADVARGDRFVIRIGDDLIPVSGKTGKWLTNIQIRNDDVFELAKGDPQKLSLHASTDKVYHPDQLAFDQKYGIRTHTLEGENVCYAALGNRTDPKCMLVTFPGVSNFDNVNYRLSALTSLQHHLDKSTLIVAFQDKEGVYGNYMFETSSGYPIRAIGMSLIKGLAVRYGIDESKIVFYGNSKGGSIAIDYIEHFPSSHFFIDIPQLDLFNYKSQNNLMRYSIGVRSRNHYHFLESLPVLNNANVSYSFAENDFDASRGFEMSRFPGIKVNMLKDMGHSNSAMELVKRQFTKIFQLVNGVEVSQRPQLGCHAEVKGDRLYLKRFLTGFRNQLQAQQLYAEINFSGTHTVYSVSLNKALREGGTLVWWQEGLDVMKHLPRGRHSMSLTLYSNFKEIHYPLDKALVVGDGTAEVIELASAPRQPTPSDARVMESASVAPEGSLTTLG